MRPLTALMTRTVNVARTAANVRQHVTTPQSRIAVCLNLHLLRNLVNTGTHARRMLIVMESIPAGILTWMAPETSACAHLEPNTSKPPTNARKVRFQQHYDADSTAFHIIILKRFAKRLGQEKGSYGAMHFHQLTISSFRNTFAEKCSYVTTARYLFHSFQYYSKKQLP